MRSFLLLLLAHFAFQSTALAQIGEVEPCTDLETPLPQQKGGLCIYPGDQNADVLYYLHGKDGDAKTWGLDSWWSQQIRDWWKAHGQPAPTIVSVSLGAIWLLSPKTSAPAGFGLFDYFTGKLMPEIEARLGGIKGRRLLLGESMGGFNAIQLGMKTDLFVKVAALCAPIADGVLSPFASDEEISAYVRKSSAVRSGKNEFEIVFGNMKMVQMVAGFFWNDQKEWEPSDPVLMAKGLRSPRAAQWYLATGYHDHYAAYEGNEAFAASLKASGTSVEWRPQWGGHCAVDVPSLADFLTK